MGTSNAAPMDQAVYRRGDGCAAYRAARARCGVLQGDYRSERRVGFGICRARGRALGCFARGARKRAGLGSGTPLRRASGSEAPPMTFDFDVAVIGGVPARTGEAPHLVLQARLA